MQAWVGEALPLAFRILPQFSCAPFPSTPSASPSSSPVPGKMKECLRPDSSSMTKPCLGGEGQRTSTNNQTKPAQVSGGGNRLGPPWTGSRGSAGGGSIPLSQSWRHPVTSLRSAVCDPWCNANFQCVPAWVRMGQSQSEPASPRVQDPVRMFLPSFLPALAQPERGSSLPSS